MHIVIPVKPARLNEELRYSLRAIDRHVAHHQVWLVGDVMPRWLKPGSVETITSRKARTKYRTTTLHMVRAAKDDRLPDEFVWWNDDFFPLADVDEIPIAHRGKVADVRAEYRKAGISGAYMSGLIATQRHLVAQGFNEPWSYELHVPFPVSKPLIARMAISAAQLPVIHKRTVIGALGQYGGSRMGDVKIVDCKRDLPGDWDWVSTDDGSFKFGRVGEQIRDRFPVPSRFET